MPWPPAASNCERGSKLDLRRKEQNATKNSTFIQACSATLSSKPLHSRDKMSIDIFSFRFLFSPRIFRSDRFNILLSMSVINSISSPILVKTVHAFLTSKLCAEVWRTEYEFSLNPGKRIRSSEVSSEDWFQLSLEKFKPSNWNFRLRTRFSVFVPEWRTTNCMVDPLNQEGLCH